jgi:hypothetical protein
MKDGGGRVKEGSKVRALFTKVDESIDDELNDDDGDGGSIAGGVRRNGDPTSARFGSVSSDVPGNAACNG